MWRASLCLLLAATGTLAAQSRVTPPPASTPPSLPAGVSLAAPAKLPEGPAFNPRPTGWWKKKQPCPKGARLSTEKIDSRLHGVVCRDRDDKQHGPGLAMFAGDKPYEDSWSEHGMNHGTRWTWHPDGRIDHIESFVDGKLAGPAEEWSGTHKLREGAYLDGKKHGLWTDYVPTGLVLRGYYDHGTSVGEWIGTRDGVATAIVHGTMGTGTGTRTWRVFDANGNLTFERVVRDDGERATGWSAAGVLIAEYDCGADGALTEARFFDDRGTLARRYRPARYPAPEALTDASGKPVIVSDKRRGYLAGAREACSAPTWMLEGAPPSRDAAFDRGP